MTAAPTLSSRLTEESCLAPCLAPFIVLLCLYKRFRVQYMILAKRMPMSPNGLPKVLPGYFFPSLFCWIRMSLTAALAFRLPPSLGPRRTFSARGLGACTGFFLRCCLRLATSSIYCRRNSSASRLSASPSASSSFAAACVGTSYISTVTVLAIRLCCGTSVFRGDVRLFSWRKSSTSWSRLTSSLPRRFRGRQGLPSGPILCFFVTRASPTTEPRLWSSLISTSTILPWMIGLSGPLRAGSCSWSGASPSSCSGWFGCLRPDRRDSMYAFLLD